MADLQSPVDQTEFYIRTEIRQEDPVDLQAIVSAILSLGGNKSEDGFFFSSGPQRAAAVEVLGEKFGSRYFSIVD